MKKIGIVLILLLAAGFFSFQSTTSSQTTAVNPVKITQKIPEPESGKDSDKRIAEERSETTQSKGNKKSAILAKSVQNNDDKSIYSIQTGAYKNLDSAVDRVLNFVSLGYNPFYSCEMVKGKGQLYKVYTERFPSKAEAKIKALGLKKSGMISDFVIRAIDDISQTEISACEPGTPTYLLHVNSFQQKIYAEKDVQRLKKSGYNALAILEKVDGVKWFRIYTGKFASENEARRTGSELKAKGLSSYFKPIPFDNIIPLSKVVASKPSQQSPPPGKFEKATPPDPTESQLIQPPQNDQKKSEKTVDKKITPLVINDITFSVKKGERELVLLHANRYFSPSVRFNLKEEKPTIFIDIDPPVTVQNVDAEIAINGKWIKQIDTRSDHNSKAIRIVVYLHASENYKVSQSFYKAEKIFALKITAKKNTRKK